MNPYSCTEPHWPQRMSLRQVYQFAQIQLHVIIGLDSNWLILKWMEPWYKGTLHDVHNGVILASQDTWQIDAFRLLNVQVEVHIFLCFAWEQLLSSSWDLEYDAVESEEARFQCSRWRAKSRDREVWVMKLVMFQSTPKRLQSPFLRKMLFLQTVSACMLSRKAPVSETVDKIGYQNSFCNKFSFIPLSSVSFKVII